MKTAPPAKKAEPAKPTKQKDTPKRENDGVLKRFRTA
jgi:hypothetical protein